MKDAGLGGAAWGSVCQHFLQLETSPGKVQPHRRWPCLHGVSRTKAQGEGGPCRTLDACRLPRPPSRPAQVANPLGENPRPACTQGRPPAQTRFLPCSHAGSPVTPHVGALGPPMPGSPLHSQSVRPPPGPCTPRHGCSSQGLSKAVPQLYALSRGCSRGCWLTVVAVVARSCAAQTKGAQGP